MLPASCNECRYQSENYRNQIPHSCRRLTRIQKSDYFLPEYPRRPAACPHCESCLHYENRYCHKQLGPVQPDQYCQQHKSKENYI